MLKAVRSRLTKRVNKDPVAAIVMEVDEDFRVVDLGVADAEAISSSRSVVGRAQSFRGAGAPAAEFLWSKT
jgi:hypothetical protein